MAKDFYLDPERLEAANSKIRAAHGGLESAFQDLTGILDDHHGCWGDDDIGKAFEKNYTEPEKSIREASKVLIEGVDGTADQIATNVRDFQELDQQNANNVK